mmetsp:Transcript_27113/g.73050  ORF Transcript_27113/g.73050 Transcript_27113/m.73050 type:complete len:452 (+) Transcript_27113:297-1652(+)
MTDLAFMIITGEGGLPSDDVERHLRLLERAAATGLVEGRFNLGVTLVTHGMDPPRGLELIRATAEEGFANAQFTIFIMHFPVNHREYGEGTKKDAFFNACVKAGVGPDPVLAADMVHRAAQQGHGEAQYYYAQCLQFGYGVEEDVKKAYRWYKMAAACGHAGAANKCGNLLSAGLVDDRTNDAGSRSPEPDSSATAALHYRRGAERGDLNSMFNLANTLMFGEGVPRDDAEAVRWLREAAGRGHPQSQFNLGMSLLSGRGVARDEADANVWFRKGADQGFPDAMNNLAFSYRLGRGGLKKDPAAAAALLEKVIATPEPAAVSFETLGQLLLEGEGGVRRDVPRAAVLLARANRMSGLSMAYMMCLPILQQDRQAAAAVCLPCGKDTRLKVCSKCHVARFCSKECVAHGWKEHKPNCKRWAAEAKAGVPPTDGDGKQAQAGRTSSGVTTTAS